MNTTEFIKENWPYLVAIGGWLFTLGTMTTLMVAWKDQLNKLEQRMASVEKTANAWLTIVNNFNNLVKMIEDDNKEQEKYRELMSTQVDKIFNKFEKQEENIKDFYAKYDLPLKK